MGFYTDLTESIFLGDSLTALIALSYESTILNLGFKVGLEKLLILIAAGVASYLVVIV